MNRWSIMRLTLSTACALLVGCSVGPPYVRPSVPTPVRYQATADTAGTKAPPDSDWPDADWWHGFGSAQLDQLIAAARQSNDDLAAAMARVEQADAQLKIAGASLFPSLDLSADATRERAVVSGQGPRTFNVFNPELTASYEIDFWGKNRALRRAARAAAIGSRFDRQTVALTVVSSVAGTYFQALAAHDRLLVAQRNLHNGEHILRGLQAQQSAGTVTGLDVAQQETAVALLSAAIPPIEQQYRQSLYGLAVLVGKTPEELTLAPGALAELEPPRVRAGIPSRLLARRPDVASAEEQLIAANADITVARAALFPSIELTAGGGYESGLLSGLIGPANRIYAVSGGLTQPIFRGGALRGQVRYSEARYRELVSTYHKSVIAAFSNVDSALIATRQTEEQQTRQRDAVATARRAYQFAEAQLSAGTINILTVLNTENTLFSAEDAFVQIQYAHLQALVDLFTALGGGWEQESDNK